ncbi:MAG: hypothetical protein J6D02_10955 [Lachnospira sp.]|nr:hypothetical protein [Lachnospira sp.]
MKPTSYKKKQQKKQIKTSIIIIIWVILIGLFLSLILWKNQQITVNGTLLKAPAIKELPILEAVDTQEGYL